MRNGIHLLHFQTSIIRRFTEGESYHKQRSLGNASLAVLQYASAAATSMGHMSVVLIVYSLWRGSDGVCCGFTPHAAHATSGGQAGVIPDIISVSRNNWAE